MQFRSELKTNARYEAPGGSSWRGQTSGKGRLFRDFPPFSDEPQAYLMMARYYGSSLARFESPDPGRDIGLEDPQSWNKYTYVGNNPLRYSDPSGTVSNDFLGGYYSKPLPDTRVYCNVECMEASGYFFHLFSGGGGQSATAQNQNQQKQLSADDVSQAVKTYDSDKGDKGPERLVKALATLGDNYTVSGNTLRAGVKQSGVELPSSANKVLGNVNSISRTGDKVVITNKGAITIKALVQLDKTISFTVTTVKGKPALRDIEGMSRSPLKVDGDPGSRFTPR